MINTLFSSNTCHFRGDFFITKFICDIDEPDSCTIFSDICRKWIVNKNMTCKISKMEGDETSENYEKPKQMKYEQQQSRWKK